MKSLEDIIKQADPSELEMEVPSAGHMERFMQKASFSEPKKTTVRTRPFIRWAGIAAAAILAALIPMGVRNSRIANGDFDYLAKAETSENIYEQYLALVQKEYDTMISKGGVDGTEWFYTFEALTSENIPLAEVLPEDLTQSETAAILKDHYNAILNGIASLRYNSDKLK